MSRTKRAVAGPRMPCGRRHHPALACAHCENAERQRKATAFRLSASAAREKAHEFRRRAAEADAMAEQLDAYAALCEAP